MKQEFDQELDSLLRAHARRETGARVLAAQGGARAAEPTHLDADELSAYAEGGLRAAARARYTAHLADCDSCRAQVVVLARAAGLADQPAQRAEHKTQRAPVVSWRERLAAFFRFSTWRYALPALALLFISGLVLLVMTGTRRANKAGAPREQIAATSAANEEERLHHAPYAEENDKATAPPPASTKTTTASANGNATVGNAAPAASGTPTDELTARPGEFRNAPASAAPSQSQLGGSIASSAEQSATPANETRQYTSANQSAGAGLSSQNAQQQQPLQVLPPPAPTTAPASSTANAAGEAKESQSKPARESVTGTGEQARNERDDDANARRRSEPKQEESESARAVNGDRASGPNRGTSAAKARRAAEPKDKPEDDKPRASSGRLDATTAGGATATETGPTRSVGGRKFRQQKGVWLDTAYKAGQATVSVRRDTEQWRALVADEPELRRIADALGGETIVVWKGRAYHIKP